MNRNNTLFILIFSLSNSLYACPQLITQALEALDWSQRLQVTEQAFKDCPNFMAAYQHGLSQMHLGDTAGAMQTFNDYAYPVAETPQQRGLADLAMAKIFTTRQEFCLAANHLQQAQQAGLKDNADYQLAWLDYQQQRSRTVVKADDIVCEFQAKSSFSWQPRIDLPIHFAFNRADLSPDGLQQTLELGQALTKLPQSANSPATFNLVGHTDTVGTDQYNQTLSEQRAATVRVVLSAHFPELKGKLHSAGRGETQPVSTGNTDADHQINRRVEIEWVH